MSDLPRLRVDGLVESAVDLSHDDFAAFDDRDRVPDVSTFHPSRRGVAVALEAILDRVGPLPGANYLTLHADRDDFHVSIPLAAVRAEGFVVYGHAGHPLATGDGGPFRFLIRDPSACHTSELDDCANVKYLSRIELSERRKRDTRPADESAHAALHANPPTDDS